MKYHNVPSDIMAHFNMLSVNLLYAWMISGFPVIT